MWGGGGCVDIGSHVGWLVGCWPVAWTSVCWIVDGYLAGGKEVGERGRLVGVGGDFGEGVLLSGYWVMGSWILDRGCRLGNCLAYVLGARLLD